MGHEGQGEPLARLKHLLPELKLPKDMLDLAAHIVETKSSITVVIFV
jgi:hypothetical protein